MAGERAFFFLEGSGFRVQGCGEDARDVEERLGIAANGIEGGVENAGGPTSVENFEELLAGRLKSGPAGGVCQFRPVGGRRFWRGEDCQCFVTIGQAPSRETSLLVLDAVEELREEVGGRGLGSQGSGVGERIILNRAFW